MITLLTIYVILGTVCVFFGTHVLLDTIHATFFEENDDE